MRNGGSLSLLLAAFLMAGCGGGGGGPTAADLTTDNAEDVAGIAIGMIGFSEELVYLLDEFTALIEDEVPSGTYPGTGGGTLTLAVQDSTPKGQLSAGDRVVLEFSDFVLDPLDPDFRIDGSFSFVVNSAMEAMPEEEYVVTYDLSHLAVSMTGVDLIYLGSLTATERTEDQISWTTEIDIPSLRSTIDVEGVGRFDQRVESATLREERDDIDDEWTAWIEGDFYDSGVGGVMKLETVLPFEGEGDDAPHTGILDIVGAGDSLVRVIAVDSTNVILEVDENGDGTIDDTINTTWEAINAGS